MILITDCPWAVFLIAYLLYLYLMCLLLTVFVICLASFSLAGLVKLASGLDGISSYALASD